MSLLTSQGNLKSQSITNEVLLDKRAYRVVKAWQKHGFPYYSQSWRHDVGKKSGGVSGERMKKFMAVDDDKSLDFNNRIFKFNNAGLALAWSYHPEAFGVRCNDLMSPLDVFNNTEIFTNAVRKILKGSFFAKKPIEELMPPLGAEAIRGALRRITGAQMVSNFRPITASALYKLFTKEGDTVWDMSMGWGGRLLASFKADINYIGTDPSHNAYTNNLRMAKELQSNGQGLLPSTDTSNFPEVKFGKKRIKELHKLGSEVFRPDKKSLDFAFTSPPYFGTEKYSDEPTQSYLKYSNIENWKEDFLRKTIENVYYGLKPNRFMCLNVADVKSYPTFEADTKQIAKEVGFKHVDTFDYRLSSQQADYKSEPMFIFKKGK